MVFQWKDKYESTANANLVADEILTIPEPTPVQIVKFAKNPETELHKCFEWNDTVAAYRYRIDQAKQLVEAIVVVDPGETVRDRHVEVKAFSTVTRDDRQVYVPVEIHEGTFLRESPTPVRQGLSAAGTPLESILDSIDTALSKARKIQNATKLVAVLEEARRLAELAVGERLSTVGAKSGLFHEPALTLKRRWRPARRGRDGQDTSGDLP